MSVAIIDKIKNGELWDFPGGVHPQQFKELSNQQPISKLALPELLYLPVKQHVGVSGKLSVEKGDSVLKGQTLSSSANPFAVPVHAPTSGEVVDITEHVSAHPSGLPEKTIIIRPDGKEKWVDLNPVADFQKYSRMQLTELICNAGISGMGGAGFPTHIKVSSSKNIEFLIINGIECEPYITSDDRLMREHAWQIRQGIDVLSYILQPQHIIVAVEDNKPEALEALRIAIQDNDKIVLSSVPTKYPAGGEKQLIQVLTGREVPSDGLPVDVGTMMYNVGTCYAIADAVFSGKPLIERVVTITGQAIERRQNVWALFGTPVSHLLDQAGYQADKQRSPYVIMGGPMMGFAIHSQQVPVIKTTNCLLVPAENEVATIEQEQACIRCGACADACPAGLLPQQLFWHSKGKEYDKAQEYDLFDCIECGACAFVCPSSIPLVHYYRKAKADIRIQQEEQHKADKARERFEARNRRLEKEKQAREEKARQAAAARAEKQQQKSDKDDQSSRVAAALARAKAKKAQVQEVPSESSSQETAPVEVQNPPEAQSETSPKDDKKQRVAEAIARAKAKKAAQAQDTEAKSNESSSEKPEAEQTSSQPSDTQKRVADAIARAKAKKAAKQQKDNS
ncbi:MAG: electron transport complex subunit RsxC [Aestuariibacter sp.]